MLAIATYRVIFNNVAVPRTSDHHRRHRLPPFSIHRDTQHAMQHATRSIPRALRRSLSTQVSQNPGIVEHYVRRKIRKQVDRLPCQGADPADSYKHGWRLASAVMLERYPIVMPEMHPFEADYVRGRFLDQQLHAKPMPIEAFLTDKDRVEGRTEPNLDDPVADQYEPASCVTDADHTNDTRSLDRALAERLYLVTRAAGRSPRFRFPQMVVDDAAVPMVTFAERALRAVTKVDKRPRVHFVAPRPACHLEHVFPIAYQQKHDVYGVKIFFYRAILIKGGIDEVRNAEDFAWARESELHQFVGDEYFNAIKPALLGVGPRIQYEV